MTTKTVTIGGDGGAVVITKTDDGTTMTNVAPAPGSTTEVPVVIHHGHQHPFDGGSFIAGLIVGMLLLIVFQRRARRRRHRPVDLDRTGEPDQARMAADVAALARRTATLETIVTDPAQRTARDIDALR